MKERQEGYYWVKWHDGEWAIAHYIKGKSYDYWYIPGDEENKSEEDFSEIDGQPITRVKN